MFGRIKLLYYLLRTKTIFIRRFSNGMGDNLLLSILPPLVKRVHPDHTLVVETSWPDLFINNPHVDWATTAHIKTTRRHIRPKYRIDERTTTSIYKQMSNYITEVAARGPELYLSTAEQIRIGNMYPFPYITICPMGKQSFSANRKEWGPEKFQALRDLLNEYQFLQIGRPTDSLLENVIDGRSLSIRDSAAAIANSLFFVGLEGGLMHLAKSVGKQSIIIYGGFLRPELSAYQTNINIVNLQDCSPCFHSDRPHTPCRTMKCMKSITPQSVYSLITRHMLGGGPDHRSSGS